MDRRRPRPSRSRLALALALISLASPALANPCPPVPLDPPTLPRFSAAVRGGRPITIIALGSSSTRGEGASDAAASYPARPWAAAGVPHPELLISDGLHHK